jgi:hypothetical protein
MAYLLTAVPCSVQPGTLIVGSWLSIMFRVGEARHFPGIRGARREDDMGLRRHRLLQFWGPLWHDLLLDRYDRLSGPILS